MLENETQETVDDPHVVETFGKLWYDPSPQPLMMAEGHHDAELEDMKPWKLNSYRGERPTTDKINEEEKVTSTIDATLEERGSRYGEFDEHARITQNIKRAMVDSPNWDSLPDYMKESLEMLAHKAGRILNGDPYYDDSWHDICGYSKLVEDKLKQQGSWQVNTGNHPSINESREVEVRLRNGEPITELANKLRWSLDGGEYDILEYRFI